MTILIVEDNAAVRRLIRRVICDVAETIIECGDGGDAPHAYNLHRPDLVLMDIRMPGTDGLSATKTLTSRFSGAKVLILTDYDGEELRSAAMEAGACGYALKEDLTVLAELISQHIAGDIGPR